MLRLVPVASVIASNRGNAAAPVIDTTDDDSTKAWAARFHISSDDLVAAINEVGPSVAAVRRHLAK